MFSDQRARAPRAVARVFGLLAILYGATAPAATLSVDSTADTGDTAGMATLCGTVPGSCTLRAALQQAAENADASNTITFAATVDGGTTTANVNGDYPVVTKPLTITGPAGRFTVNGNAVSSLFRFTGAAGAYSISNLVITNARGDAVAPATVNGGGGIFFNPGGASTLVLADVDLTNNRAVSTGGAPGGGLYVGSGHTVTVTRGLISGNSTAGDTAPAGSNGGGIFNAGTLTLGGTTVSGNTAAQGGAIFNGASLALGKNGSTPVTLTGNTASGLGGGAIYNFDGTLTAADAVIGGNAASGVAAVGGGGIYSELDSGGATTLTRVTITGNTVGGTGNGGGIFARKLAASADFSLADSTVAGNAASGGAGGGLFVKRGLVQITGSTISGNDASSSGGGIFLDVDGGGGRVAVTNSTISGNGAVVGGGIGVNKNNVSASSMIHVTLAENTASDASGGGGISYGLPADGALNPNLVFPGTFGNAFTSNVIVKNTAGGALQNCRTAFTHSNANDSGYNVTDDATCGFTQSTDRTVTSPAPLGMLADNLGSTQTHALLAGNPAIDHANPLYMIAADQRGAAAQDGDESGAAARDGGAYEYGGFGVMRFDTDTYTVREDAGSLTAVVKRFGNAAVATSVAVSTADVTATAPADYISLSNQNVAFAAAGLAENVVVTINDDDLFPETGEKFSLLLSAPQQGSDLGAQDSATVTITDVEEGAFQFEQAAYAAPEGGTAAANENGTVTITVTRASGSDKAVTVSYSVSGGTAVAGEDYVANSAAGSLSWVDGDSAPKSFDVQLLDDIADETGGAGTRTLELTLADPPGRARLGTPATTTLTLTDDDPTPEVTLEINPTTFNETGGTATVTAKLVGSTATTAATVNLVFSGTANRDATCGTVQNPADYTCSANVITIAAGATSGSITLTGIEDVENETDETVIVDVASTSANVVEQGSQQVMATIAEVAAVRGDFSLSSAAYTALEAGGSLVVTVTRANGDDGAASVQCTTVNGSAVAGTDFNATPSPATLNWADNETGDKTCTFTLTNDSNRESNKSFTVRLANATGAGLGAISEAAVTLVSDEQPRFQFNLATALVQEGTMGFQVAVEALDVVDGDPVTIAFFTADGTATAASMDYTETSGSLTWNNGDGSTKTFTIAMVAADGEIEGNETFAVNLGAPAGGGQVVGNNPTTITIVDPPAVRFKAAMFGSADEQDGSIIRACAERIGNPQGPVSVEYDVTGDTATEGADYTPPSGTPMHVLSWANNDTADKCFDITIIGDPIDESEETITLALLNPSSGLSIGSPNPAQAVITDDDSVTVSFTAAAQTVGEDAGTVTVTATRTGATDFDIDVPFTVSGTATHPVDHGAVDGTITIPATSSSGTYAFAVTDDSRDEFDETVVFTMGTPTGGDVTAVAPTTHTVTITDNDAVTVSFSASAQAVGENAGMVTVTVARTGASDFDIDVPFTVSGTAANPADHDAVGGTISIPAAASSGSYAFTVVDDTLGESNEIVVFTMGTPTGGDVTAVAPTTHTVTIADNDTAGVAVTQTGGATAVTEDGATDTYSLVLTSQPTASVTIAIDAGSQLTASPTSVTFTTADWDVPQTVTVTAVDDTTAESTHVATILHSASSTDAAYDGIAVASVDVTITDNDSVAAGEQAPGIVVTPSGNVASGSGDGGALGWSSLLALLGLAGLRRRVAAVATMLALVIGATPAQAASKSPPEPASQTTPSYRSFDLRYLTVKVDDPAVDADGVTLAGSWAAGRELYLAGSYSSVETDRLRIGNVVGSTLTETFGLGLGWHRAVRDGIDFAASVSLLSADAEGQGGFTGSSSDTGFGFDAGFRGRHSSRLEWGIGLSHVSIFGDNDTGLSAQVFHYLRRDFGVIAGAGFGSNSSQFNAGIRYNY